MSPESETKIFLLIEKVLTKQDALAYDIKMLKHKVDSLLPKTGLYAVVEELELRGGKIE